MASTSGVQPQGYQPANNQQQNSSPHQCKECGLYMNSAESLEVHLQYHKENLLKNWAIQAATSHSEETNNNTTKAAIKREFIPNNSVVSADSTESASKKSPAPDQIFGHPPTPQSYQSASSPYQNQDNNSAFSPSFQNFQIKAERASPNPHYQQQPYQNFPEQHQQFFDANGQYSQPEYQVHKPSYRYHPYGQVSSSSPAYPPQPTPSPSPKQCDKCGYVCESATQLIDHQNMAHPQTPLSAYQSNQHFMFGNEHSQPPIKTEDDAQSEILDLDSHKVVHQVYPDDEKRQNGDPNGPSPHSVSAMLNSWSPTQQQMQQHKMFEQQQQQQQQRLYMGQPPQQPQHQMHNSEFMNNGVSTTSPDHGSSNGMSPPNQPYRPFEHLPSQPPAPVISTTQVPNATPAAMPPGTKSANWKSNEARRPKTYNCTACNKWFTSSGHLKRHYNTTLHKNAVKSSGQPDPATLPISAHHHPARENNSNREDNNSNSPGEEMRGEDTNSMPPQFDRPNPMPGLLQQPPNGPYDRQPAPNIHHTPPLHSPMSHSPMPHSPMPPHNPMINPSLTNMSNGSPPNGEAGLSPTNLDSRGLLSLSSPTLSMGNTTTNPHGFNMAPPPPPHMMPMEGNQFQMYPNESAPHVTQAMAINNLNTTGEYQYDDATVLGTANSPFSEQDQHDQQQPLPSFAHFQSQRYGGLLLSYGNANVGGGGPATAPYTYYNANDSYEMANDPRYKSEDDYKLTVLTAAEPAPLQDEYITYATTINNNTIQQSNNLLTITSSTQLHEMDDLKMRLDSQPASPEKAHIKRDYEEHPPQITSTSSNSIITKNGLHKCIDCDKVFNKACYLTQHNKTFHSGDKPFKCTRCGKRFSCEVTYQEHLSKHAGEKPHKCELCPKQFNHKTDLRRHMCLHTGQKPYACDTCGKGFIRKDHMMKHCETHVRKTQSKIAAMR